MRWISFSCIQIGQDLEDAPVVALAIKTRSGLCSTLAPIMAFNATLPTRNWIFAKSFGVTKLLTVEASQRVWDVHLDLDYIISNFKLLWWGRCIKCYKECVCLNLLSIFFKQETGKHL